jgi:hypothetical protein
VEQFEQIPLALGAGVAFGMGITGGVDFDIAQEAIT